MRSVGDKGMAQRAEWRKENTKESEREHEDPSSSPRALYKMLGMVVGTCDPGQGQGRQEDP